MKKPCLMILILLVLSGFVYGSAIAADEPMLVNADWLAKHIDDKNLVLPHVGDKEYDAGHIPGACQSCEPIFSTPPGEGRLILQLPPVEQLKASFEKFECRTIHASSFTSALADGSLQRRVYFTLIIWD